MPKLPTSAKTRQTSPEVGENCREMKELVMINFDKHRQSLGEDWRVIKKMELSKAEAAKYLGISTRALERYTQQGKIGVKYVKGKRGKQARYQSAELEELKKELSTETHKPTVEQVSTVTDNLPVGISALVEKIALPITSHLAVLTEAVQNLQRASNRPFVPIEEKLLLTLPEVQALTGLSRDTLRDAIKQNELSAKIIGKAWRIKRSDLEDYIENL